MAHATLFIQCIVDGMYAAKHYIETVEDYETIVCPSDPCVSMVRHHYPELFENELA